MKVQPHVSSEDGKIFDISINTNEISFIILELTEEEINEMVKDILQQVFSVKKAYQEIRKKSK